MKPLLYFKDEVAKEMGYKNYAEAKKKAFISNELEKAVDMVAERFAHQFKVKSDKWDKLDEKLGTVYVEDEDNAEPPVDLVTIGEWAASAFGYL